MQQLWYLDFSKKTMFVEDHLTKRQWGIYKNKEIIALSNVPASKLKNYYNQSFS